MFASGTQRRPEGTVTSIRREIALVYPSPDSIVYGVPFFEESGQAMLPGSFATYTARRESPGSKRFIGGTWCPGPDVLTRPNRLVLVEP